MDNRDPRPLGFGRIPEARRRAPPEQLSGVGRDHPGGDLHQRGFAGAVFAQQKMDFARGHPQIAPAQGGDAPEAFLHLLEFEHHQAKQTD